MPRLLHHISVRYLYETTLLLFCSLIGPKQRLSVMVL